jgi:hypothetical protein
MQDMTWQGVDFPSVEPRFVCTHRAIAQPSRASWRLAARRTRTFQGQLFHPWVASPRRYGPTAHCLPVQAMEIFSHSITTLRGAPVMGVSFPTTTACSPQGITGPRTCQPPAACEPTASPACGGSTTIRLTSGHGLPLVAIEVPDAQGSDPQQVSLTAPARRGADPCRPHGRPET